MLSILKVKKETQNWKRPWANFTNNLRAAFTLADPKCAKKDSQLKQLFRFQDLQAYKLRVYTLMKLTPHRVALLPSKTKRDGLIFVRSCSNVFVVLSHLKITIY